MAESGKAKLLVLIAVDGSPQADSALRYFSSKLYNSHVHNLVLVHVTEGPQIPQKRYSRHTYYDKEMWTDELKANEKNIEGALKKYQKMLNNLKIEADFTPLYSMKAGQAIIDEATESKANLIVTGTRGMGTMRRTVLGSVSDYVVHHAPCPVLVCPMD